jgi:hypothetical protein
VFFYVRFFRAMQDVRHETVCDRVAFILWLTSACLPDGEAGLTKASRLKTFLEKLPKFY